MVNSVTGSSISAPAAPSDLRRARRDDLAAAPKHILNVQLRTFQPSLVFVNTSITSASAALGASRF